jgi:transcription elongation factor Elf1
MAKTRHRKEGPEGGHAMDKVTRCLHCGKRLVPVPSADGRTELQCVWCDKLDPMEMTAANKWADSPLATPISEAVPETVF